jgi:hypothetical protein
VFIIGALFADVGDATSEATARTNDGARIAPPCHLYARTRDHRYVLLRLNGVGLRLRDFDRVLVVVCVEQFRAYVSK